MLRAAAGPRAIVIMGVAGAGKTTIGREVAAATGLPFFDGDDYHPPANIAKMTAGVPLADADREPWLDALNRLIRDQLAAGSGLVLASSALKAAYRQRLAAGVPAITFVYLNVDPATLAARLAGRADHFMPAELLASQLSTLEIPDDAIVVDGSAAPAEVVAAILAALPD